jgi:hypothetical protein
MIAKCSECGAPTKPLINPDALRCSNPNCQHQPPVRNIYDELRQAAGVLLLQHRIDELEIRIKELEESQDDAESIMSCLAMQARFYQRDMPLTTPVLQHGNSKLTVAVLFLAEDWYVNRLDAEKRAEWEKIAAEMRSKIGKDEE